MGVPYQHQGDTRADTDTAKQRSRAACLETCRKISIHERYMYQRLRSALFTQNLPMWKKVFWNCNETKDDWQKRLQKKKKSLDVCTVLLQINDNVYQWIALLKLNKLQRFATTAQKKMGKRAYKTIWMTNKKTVVRAH